MVGYAVKVIHLFRFDFQSLFQSGFRFLQLPNLLEEKTKVVMGLGPFRHSVAELVCLAEKAGIEPAQISDI